MDWRPEVPVDAEQARLLLAKNVALLRNPACRFAFLKEREGSVSLFVDGACHACAGQAAAFAELICAQDRVTASPDMIASDLAMDLIVQLLNQGNTAFDPEA
jgi:50S ribosomal protein L16 3-hydroxylase